ncbi:MAG TPA: hypothetical protein VG754_07115 [Verrucomicrobiae bacterium]|jgi:hypothetical protein|nr:hypothetical protein [Verrucomicrobiae bacterium]
MPAASYQNCHEKAQKAQAQTEKNQTGLHTAPMTLFRRMKSHVKNRHRQCPICMTSDSFRQTPNQPEKI